MKIEKYIFCFNKANSWAASKFDLEPLTQTQLQVIYAVRRLNTSTNATIIQYLRKMQNKANDNAISTCLKDLTAMELLERAGKAYNLTYKGREYLAIVRRYLFNVRL